MTFRTIHLGALLAAMSIGASDASAQADPALLSRLDSITGADVAEMRAVGLVIAVEKGKDRLLLRAYGDADSEGDVALTTNTIMALGSVTKQFTAAAILQLRDAGKLSLDDPITRWLPEFGTRGDGVTLRHLLGHTAGIVDAAQMPEMRAMQLLRNFNVTRDSAYAIISRYAPQFPPGTMQVYSNTGYWLLGRVIEKASGMAYEEYVQKGIFEPLGMTRSMFCTNAENVPDRAFGHGMRNGTSGRVPAVAHTVATYAGGGLCSTAEDMVTWLQALHGGRVLSPGSYAEMIAPHRLADGTSTRYGMGLTVWNDSRGLSQIGHGGGGFGFSSQAWWYPDSQLAVVVLTNSEPDNTTAIAEALSAAILPAASVAAAFAGDGAPLVGTYGGPFGGGEMIIAVAPSPEGLTVSIDGGAATPLEWLEDRNFRAGAAQISFRSDGAGGPATELRYDTGGDHLILRRR